MPKIMQRTDDSYIEPGKSFSRRGSGVKLDRSNALAWCSPAQRELRGQTLSSTSTPWPFKDFDPDWSAPSQPFVLPARVHNFESVCQRRAGPGAGVVATRKPDEKKLRTAVAKAVQEALVSNNQVWLYRLSKLYGKEEAGLVTFIRDYLHEAVAKRIANDPGQASGRSDPLRERPRMARRRREGRG
jgi:hypothetical protein